MYSSRNIQVHRSNRMSYDIFGHPIPRMKFKNYFEEVLKESNASEIFTFIDSDKSQYFSIYYPTVKRTIPENPELFYKNNNPKISIPDGYHVRIYLNSQEKPHIAIGIPYAILCTSTLYLIPSYGNTTYTIVCDLLKNNVFVKRYTYQREMSTWVHCFLIFVLNDTIEKDTAGEIMKDMIINFVVDLQMDMNHR